tara:strand:- start:4576 stop:5409 length:834 start_codon:yes stop_codon:yes gene_type:complete
MRKFNLDVSFGFCTFQVYMKTTFLIALLISFSIFSQEPIETTFIDETELKAETLINVDNFNTLYYIKNNVFYKKDAAKTISYNNLQLGNISSVDVFNPLKITLFYKDFNTAIILDNRLAEIFKIDFNTITPYRNITYISTGNDNTLWLYNQDSQQLEIYDYKNNITRAQSLPINSIVLDIKSNYNNCWLLTTDNLLIYNYFGVLISKIKNDDFTSMDESDENIILKKGNLLFYSKKDTSKIIPIKIPDLLINQFLLTNETLYIYTNETLQKFQLKTN